MVFSLDLGTRNLVGILAEIDDDENIIINHSFEKEHENRAMMDGQIHDVNKVAKGVKRILESINEKTGETPHEVAVALAGRFLITTTGEYELDISSQGYVDRPQVRKIELEAVKEATEKLDYSKGMYCVGYSVLYYEVDDEWIKHLEGQKGKKAKVKVIAAFLPKNVVEAMLTVLEMNGLNPIHITLEPIAAMNLVVPEDLRTLNIAMVDVGAGTSDIAISNEGTITGYGMVPLAGDEITDAITKELLIDFNSAEKIKKDLINKDSFKYKDILDFEHEISKEKIMEIIKEPIDKITSEISNKILELNGKSPVAVMLVGGGGKVPSFKEKIAEYLELEENRIALKSTDSLTKIKFEEEKMFGSEYITPIGIANSALKKEGNVFNSVTVNGTVVNMMMIGTDLSVMQVLLQMGYSPNQLIGKPSKAITYELNGEFKIKKGNLGKEAMIKINNQKANLKSKVKPGDKIELYPPEKGEDVEVTLKEIINSINYFLNGEPKKIYPKVIIDDNEVSIDTQLKDGQKIKTVTPKVKDIVEEHSESIYFTLDNVPYEIPGEFTIIRNDQIVDEEEIIKDGDSFQVKRLKLPKIKEFIDTDVKTFEVTYNGKKINLEKEKIYIKNGSKNTDLDSQVKSGSNYKIIKEEYKPNIIDLFSHLDIDTKNIKSFDLKINGEKVTSFMQKIPENSTITFKYNG
ncbi:cell division FtsA domain-containing protein [Geotoga petraea]|jgi:cell division protein FtsA|uniref:Cell division protein FtsA n=1 Tax=Geotoga petraea TaxID=28234 RepID=A0A4Z0VZ93_9BACT|nr:cell division FtsA domain-containing protein [Geotoga petraea]TGG87254.1 cell division protein FtsA [Geotoga petraea]